MLRPLSFLGKGLAFPAVLVFAGCASLPHFEGQISETEASGSVPTVSDIITHVQCEIWKIPHPTKDTPPSPESRVFERLWRHQYVVYANLTLDVTNDGQLNPTLSLMNMAKSRVLGLNAQYERVGHRQIAQTFLLDLDPAGNPTFDPGTKDGHVRTLNEFCDAHSESKDGIQGDLGIKEIVAQGLKHAVEGDFLFPFAIPADQVEKLPVGASSILPGFGTTIEFTLIKGLGGGPNWTFTHFVGPEASGSPLLNFTQTRKESLILSFAAAGQRTTAQPTPGRQGAEAANLTAERARLQAADAAKSNALQTILQRLLQMR